MALVACRPAPGPRQQAEASEAEAQIFSSGPLGPAVGQSPAQLSFAMEEGLIFEQLSVAEGLSHATVNVILQDSLGYLWFGTLDGLNRFDGYTFTHYQNDPDDPFSLSDNVVWALVEDREGNLWVGTEDGLNRLDRESGRFERFLHHPGDLQSLGNNRIRTIFEDRDGVLWIGTNGGGLNQFEPRSGRFVRYQNDPDDADSLSNNSVSSLLEDRAGNLWVGTLGGGLNRMDRLVGRFTPYTNDPNEPTSLANNFVGALYEDRAGRLWVGTPDGVLDQLDPASGRFTHYRLGSADPTSALDNAVRAIHEDRASDLWIGTMGGGLSRFDPETGQVITYRFDIDDPKSLSSNSILSIFEDRSGVLWVGTSGAGLNSTAPFARRFLHFQHDPDDPRSLGHNIVLSIFEDQTGDIWVGTARGLDRLDRQTGDFIHYTNSPFNPQSLSAGSVRAIYEDRASVLWVGTDAGLNRFERNRGRFTHFMHDPADPNSLANNVVTTLFEDSTGRFWVGTAGGLSRLDRGSGLFQHLTYDPNDSLSLSGGNVRVIYEDRQGKLWVGTDEGLNHFDPERGRFTRFQHDPDDSGSLSDNFVLSIHEDQAGNFWVGTYGGGLNRLDRASGQFSQYREKDGLPNDAVYGILEDANGGLWLSTNRGLARFDPWAEHFRSFDAADGLQSNQFSLGAHYQNARGEMFFGGINGLNVFHPADITDNDFVPPILLTALRQGGEDLPVEGLVETLGALTFHWPDNFFEFEFAALSYVQPEKNQYAYMLEGFDEGWNLVENQRTGRYTNLPVGSYTLHLRGSNNDGRWNTVGRMLEVTVLPPFWATWWFRGLTAFILLGGLIGGYRWRVKSIEARNRELQQQVRERTYEIERRRQVAEGLRDILVILNAQQSVEESLEFIAAQAERLSGAHRAAFFRLLDSEDIPPLPVELSPGELSALRDHWPEQDLLAGAPLLIPDLQPEPPDYQASGLEARALLGVPVSVEGRVQGALVLFFDVPQTFREEDLDLGFTFSDQAALAIATDRLRLEAEQSAVESERTRLARDLHDSVTQTLFSSSLIAEALPNIWQHDQQEGQHLLQEMRRLSRGALAEMRSLLLELRPGVLAEANLADLLQQLGQAATGRQDLEVDVKVAPVPALPAPVRVALYRIAQEALNNVVKHARAQSVVVHLAERPPSSAEDSAQGVRLMIRDDGCGFAPELVPPNCLGLGIMRERARAIGAAMELLSRIDEGTKIVVEWEGTT